MSKFTPEIKQFILENYPTKGRDFCVKNLGNNFTPPQITNFCCYHKIKSEKEKFGETFNLEDFINITNPLMAYFWGFCLADGHLTKTCNTLSLNIRTDDAIELYEILKPLGNFSLKHSKKRNTSTISLYNVKIGRYMKSLGFLEKSLRFDERILKTIPDHLKRYFFRGITDGDGWYQIRDGGKGGAVVWAGGKNQDWSLMTDFVNSAGCSCYISKEDNKYGSCSKLIVGSKYDAVRIGSILYKNYDIDGIGLKRKYEKFIELKNSIYTHEAGKYRGVVQYPNSFGVLTSFGKERIYKGGFENEIDAARYFDEVNVKKLGFKAKTNFPITDYIDPSYHEVYSP